MVFYKIEAEINSATGDIINLTHHEQRSLALDISLKSENLFLQSKQQRMIFTVSIRENTILIGAITNKNEEIQKHFFKYAKIFPFEITNYNIEEITFKSLYTLLINAARNNFICDEDDVLQAFSISDLTSHHIGEEFGEGIIADDMSYTKACKTANDFLFNETFNPELGRIFTKSANSKTSGHPVHYILHTNDRETRKTIYKTLLSSLYVMGRIKNKRYTFVDYDDESRFSASTFNTIYKSSQDGAVVIRYSSYETSGGEFANRSADIISAISEIAFKYRNKVLTIICLPKSAKTVKENFLMNWPTTSFIELYEDVVFGETAKMYLRNKAHENKIRTDKNLTNLINDENNGYTGSDLNRIFDEWYSKKLRTNIYPQYKTAETVKYAIQKSKPKGSAYDNLQQLIGLNEAKKVINNALDYFKAQKLFADRGIKADHPAMHMIFTGNPGTAKTTVARLFAQIMKDNGILASGTICEVGRADIVGKYVGHTAPLVKKAFKKAKGGVLFIDEAYSLVDSHDGSYGDEAINTIVQEMENNRHDTIVIFAGYPDKMENFLAKNPGLRSRIAFHVPFEDYSVEELCSISEFIASNKSLKFSDDAKEKLVQIFTDAKKQSDFGNGRYVRNIIEKSKISQSSRLLKMNLAEITNDDISTICADDIEEPTIESNAIQIGFSL